MRVVEGDEGLEGGVGAVAADGAGFAAGSVEDVHVGGVGHALPEVVEGAAIEIFTGILDVFAGVRAGKADDVPDVLGLIGASAGATSFGGECAAGGEGVIADHFGVHAEARASAEEGVGAVEFEFSRGGDGGLAIGSGRDDEFEELLGIPTGFAEFDGEPVEQFGVAGGGAHDAEVF